MHIYSYMCTEVIVAKLLLCYLFANMVFNNCFYPHDPSQKDSQTYRSFIKGISSRSKNATPPAVSTTLQTRSLWHRIMDATSGVGSARPPAKWQQRSQSTSQSSKDQAGSWPLMAQDVPTIVQSNFGCSP